MFAATDSGGRDPLSEGPRRTRHFGGRSPVLPTVATARAALRNGRLPTGRADALAFAALPRPATASLLPSSFRPQPGRAEQHDIRAGQAQRVVAKESRSELATNMARVRSTAHAEQVQQDEQEAEAGGGGLPCAGIGIAPSAVT